MKLIARIFAAFAVLATLAFATSSASATPVHIFADAKNDICAGINAAASSGAAGCDSKAAGVGVDRIIKFSISMLSLIAGIAAVIMIILAGLKYITSNGEAANITSAKHSLMYAIVGLVVVFISQFLVRYVLNRVS